MVAGAGATLHKPGFFRQAQRGGCSPVLDLCRPFVYYFLKFIAPASDFITLVGLRLGAVSPPRKLMSSQRGVHSLPRIVTGRPSANARPRATPDAGTFAPPNNTKNAGRGPPNGRLRLQRARPREPKNRAKRALTDVQGCSAVINSLPLRSSPIKHKSRTFFDLSLNTTLAWKAPIHQPHPGRPKTAIPGFAMDRGCFFFSPSVNFFSFFVLSAGCPSPAGASGAGFICVWGVRCVRMFGPAERGVSAVFCSPFAACSSRPPSSILSGLASLRETQLGRSRPGPNLSSQVADCFRLDRTVGHESRGAKARQEGAYPPGRKARIPTPWLRPADHLNGEKKCFACGFAPRRWVGHGPRADDGAVVR